MKKSLPIIVARLLLLFFLFTGCENEPVTILKDTVQQEDELFQLIENVVRTGDNPVKNNICVDFIYPLVLIKYDQYINPIQTITLFNDNQFMQLLNQLSQNQSISISYPIETITPDGTIVSINNDNELIRSLETCKDQNLIGYCIERVATSQTCIFEVPYFEDELNNEFAGAAIFTNPDFTITLYHLNNTYVGTWNVLMVNNILHLNFNLAGTSAVARYWNHNYRIADYDQVNLTLTTLTQSRKLKKKCTDSMNFNVGDVGPALGLIVYDKGIFSNGWRYIEVAPSDLNAQEEWGCIASEIQNAQYDFIGAGLQNSIAIANQHKNIPNYLSNPNVCSTANNGTVSAISSLKTIVAGKDDWFIPSIEELQILYTELHLSGSGNFSSGYYWSSSEGSTSKAKVINFGTGETVLLDKNAPSIRTRLIRVF